MSFSLLKHIIASFLLLITIGLSSCNNSKDDGILLKELKTQTDFLTKQYQRSITFFKARINSQYHGILYFPLFKAHDTLVKQTLESIDKNTDCNNYKNFILKSNHLLDSAKESETTRFLRDDYALLKMQDDSLCFFAGNPAFQKEMIRQSVLKRAILLTDLFRDCIGTSADYFYSAHSSGYRLSIQKNPDSTFFFQLKLYEPRKIPFPSHLEFVSLISTEHTTYENPVRNLKQKIKISEIKDGGIYIQTSFLEKGSYTINAHSLSISPEGKLQKFPVDFDFEIN